MGIVAGPGTAARFGDVCIWAGPGASEQLVTFLVESARNVGASPLGGARIADHIGAVLAGRDPEPGVPFACVGPGQTGTAILLHGAVQAWDGSRWLVPQPRPGWLRTEVTGSAPVSVAAHGTVSPWVPPGSDLRRGVVPAAGFSLIPDPEAAIAMVPPASASASGPSAGGPGQAAVGAGGPGQAAVGAGGPGQAGPAPPGPAPPGPAPPGPATAESTTAGPVTPGPPPSGAEPTVVDATELVDPHAHAAMDRTEVIAPTPAPPTPAPPTPAPPTPVAPPATRDRPPGVLDLAREGPSSLPPLPSVSQPHRPVPGQPVVAGVLCPVQHFNHPAVRTCVVCRRPVTAEGGRVSGSRPALGVLVVDDGAVYRLDHSYLIGSDPDSDPTVTGGRMRPLTLGPGPAGPGPAGPGPAVTASHAEIRLTGWDVSVIDRGSGGVTQVLAPGGATWTLLRPFIAHHLAPGAHIAAGSRVVSLISPWPIDAPVT